jgi:hypothetical protein
MEFKYHHTQRNNQADRQHEYSENSSKQPGEKTLQEQEAAAEYVHELIHRASKDGNYN